MYSLGAILYELLSGEKPHPGDSPNAILYHIATHAPVPLTGLVPDAPAELVASIEKAIAKEPGDRHASAAAFAEELRAFAVREVHPAPKLEASSPAASEGSQPTVLASGQAPSLAVSAVDTARPSSPGKGRRGIATAVGWGAVGAAIAVAIGWASRPGNEAPGDAPVLETKSAAPADAVAADAPEAPDAQAAAPAPATSAAPPVPSSTAPAASSTASGRPRGRPPGRPGDPAPVSAAAPATAPSPAPTPAASVRFDQKNPYD